MRDCSIIIFMRDLFILKEHKFITYQISHISKVKIMNYQINMHGRLLFIILATYFGPIGGTNTEILRY